MKSRIAGRSLARGNAALAALLLAVAFSLAAAAVPLEAAALCGDGILEGNEECDPGGLLVIDGNPDNGTCTTGNDCFYALSCCKFNCQYVGQGAPCFDGDGCTINDTCDQVGNCGGDAAPEGNACDDGLFCTLDDTCDANGNCTGSGDPCDGNPECLDVCDEDTHACLSPAGSPCGDPTDDECNGADTCDGAGNCDANLATAATPAPSTCDDANDCTADQCDGSGACDNPDLASGTACGDPSDTECTNPDICDGGGLCITNDEPLDTPCGDPSDDDCTNPDSCNASGLCVSNDEPAGAACGDPTDDECNGADTCDGSGICQANHVTAGTAAPSTCSDANECTADLCDGAGGCSNPAEPGGTACGDAGATQCDNPDTCDGSGSCSPNYVTDDTPCDDSDQCTLTDVCTAGVCTSSNLVDCDDGDLCTYDSCDPLTGECSSVAAPAPTCKAFPVAAQLKIIDRPNDAKDKLKWRWVRGEDTSFEELGTPATTTLYELCIYDMSAGVSSLTTSLVIPPGPAWQESAGKFYRYKDREATADGVSKMKIRALPKPSIGIKAQGLNMPTPVPFGPDKFFDQDPLVSVQFVTNDGQCWATDFEPLDTKINDTSRFVTIRKRLPIN